MFSSFWDYASGALFSVLFPSTFGGWPVLFRRFIHWPWHDRDGLVGRVVFFPFYKRMVHARLDEDTIGKDEGDWCRMECLSLLLLFQLLHFVFCLPACQGGSPGSQEWLANGRFDICLGDPFRIRCVNFYGDQRTRSHHFPSLRARGAELLTAPFYAGGAREVFGNGSLVYLF